MAKTRLFPFAFAAIFAASLAACDRGADDGAQENPSADATSETIALTGLLDHSFAGGDIPAVVVSDLEGVELALAEAGEPVLLNLWATWCAPCVIEMPLLDELAAQMGAETGGQVRVTTVNVDVRGDELVEPFFAEHGLPNLPRWMDAQGELAASFGGGPALPVTVLYDADGKEVWRVIGAYDWASEEARAAIIEGLE